VLISGWEVGAEGRQEVTLQKASAAQGQDDIQQNHAENIWLTV